MAWHCCVALRCVAGTVATEREGYGTETWGGSVLFFLLNDYATSGVGRGMGVGMGIWDMEGFDVRGR